ncbi:MAG: adenosylmethionine decarboxylase [Candidatus Obscuribacterales bacterium]|nr:adenosylmethionine decarboxylase [Candidatus Obscuribacterales bacterium]
MFGPHLILEAYGCPREKLADLNALSKMLDAYPKRLDMTKIMPPYVFTYTGAVAEDWGVSGVILIAESHISIHTFPDKGFATLDIFSCREFNIEDAIGYFSDHYSPESYDKHVLMRGREFPRSKGRARAIVEGERERVALSIV